MTARSDTPMWSRLIPLVFEGRMSLQAQIREMLTGAILDGRLPTGVALPSTRELAQQLGVARNTVDPGSIAFGSWNNNQHPGDPNNPGLGYSAKGHRFFLAGSYRVEYLKFGATTFSAFLEGYSQGAASYVFSGDLNGDGVTDLAVGANYDDDGGREQGAVWILFLGADGIVSYDKHFERIPGTTRLEP